LKKIALAGFGRFYLSFWPVLAGFYDTFGRFSFSNLATLMVFEPRQ
jgi:hypothetical protein